MLLCAEERAYISVYNERLEMFREHLEKMVSEGKKVVIITNEPFDLQGATVYLTECKKEQIRLITDCLLYKSDFLISTFPIDSKQESICVDPMLSEDDLNKISEKIEFFAWKEKKEKPQKNNVNVYEATLITNEINSIIKGFCFRYLPENISFTEALLKISDHFTEDTNKKEQLYKDFSEREALSTQVIEEFGIVFLHARTAVIEQSQFIVVLPEGDHFKDSYFKNTRAIIVMLIP